MAIMIRITIILETTYNSFDDEENDVVVILN